MTTEIEKQFFDTFGIEPKFKGYSNTEELSNGGVITCGSIKYFNTIEEMDRANYWCFNMLELDDEDKEYPQITDRILLELICLCQDLDEVSFINVEKLKETLLKSHINIYNYYINVELLSDWGKELKQQVRTLFEKAENE